jgi:3-dehydroquinate dehydratase-2
MKLLVMHGPNMNLLGLREPETYGYESYDELNERIVAWAKDRGVDVSIVQSNHEGELIDEIHDCIGTVDGVVINPAGLSHTSISLRDAIAAGPPTVVVHLTNIHARESIRQVDVVAPACLGGVYGFGPVVYILGLEALVQHLSR